MVRILERGITLFHPYSRNKSHKKDKFYLSFCFRNGTVKGNMVIGEIEVATAVSISAKYIQHFL